MCFSKTASIAALTVGLIGSILCISLGTISDKIVGYFLAYVVLIQGIEYLLWDHQKCDDYNRSISVLGMIQTHLQPFILGLIILLVNPRNPYNNWILLLMILYLCLIIPYSLQFDKSKQCTLEDQNVRHLKWNWVLMPYQMFIYGLFILLFAIFFILGLPNLTYGIFFALFSTISYLTSALFYTIEFSGVLWCFYAAGAPLLYYLLRITKMI